MTPADLFFTNLWPQPLLVPTMNGRGLGLHGEDSALSVRCPIYGGANARSIYFSAACDFSFTWEGGDNYHAEIPEWASIQYQNERRRWRNTAINNGFAIDPYAARYSMDSPFGGRVGGGHMLHAGGLMLILFPGLAVEIPDGYQLLVGPPTNFRYNPGWTVQQGTYSSDYHGELSFNLQVLRTGSYTIPKGTPLASGVLVRNEPPRIAVREHGNVDAFYLKKAARLLALESHSNI